jgi:uncharacterized membrane protein
METSDTAETPPPRPLWRRLLAAPEGKILLAGIALTVLYVTAVGLSRLRSPELFHKLWTMTTTHVLGGRAAGMTWGYAHKLDGRLVVLGNMAVETFLLLLFYPLFVLSYRRLILIRPLEETMARARRAAEAQRGKVVKLGVPGLLLFVWFPFWMTGPLVGSIIGFLIGMKPWVNMLVVLGGTYMAIFTWSLVLQRVHESLAKLGPYVPFFFVGLILLVAVAIHVRCAVSRPSAPGGAR